MAHQGLFETVWNFKLSALSLLLSWGEFKMLPKKAIAMELS